MSHKKNGAVLAIVGPHYSGKSTLAQKMFQTSGFTSVAEKWLDDPFTAFRRQGDYLKSQIWFLTETMKTMLEARALADQGQQIVLDTFTNTTRAFCRSKLTPTDFTVFDTLFTAVVRDFPLPDLLIYLTGSVDTLVKHSQIRAESGQGPASDKAATRDWIKKSIAANEVEFGNWTATPIIRIDIAETDLINNESDYQKLMHQIAKFI